MLSSRALAGQVRIQDLCKGGPSWDFADIAQWSRGSTNKLGLKMGGQGGAGPPGPPLDPYLLVMGKRMQEEGWVVV